MAKICYTPAAVQDLKEILVYISEELASPKAAQNTLAKIQKRISSLKRFPHLGTSLDSFLSVKTDYRRLVCGQYLVFYLTEQDTVNIIRILNGGRDYTKILFGDSPTEE